LCGVMAGTRSWGRLAEALAQYIGPTDNEAVREEAVREVARAMKVTVEAQERLLSEDGQARP